MASSIIHLCIAKEVLKHIKLNEKEFLYGNILPDFMKVKNYKLKDKLHFYEKVTIGNVTKEIVNLEKFLEKHKQHLNDSVSLGVYSHFITDYLWIKNFIIYHLISIDGKPYIKTKRGNIRNNRRTVYKDYNKIVKWLHEEYNVSLDFIKDIEYKGIFKEIYNAPKEQIYEKMNEHMQNFEEGEMDIFTKEEIKGFIKSTSIEIINILKNEIKE